MTISKQNRKLSISELETIIKEEFGKMGNVEKEAKKTKVIKPGEEGQNNEKPKDFIKMLQLKEAKLVKIYNESKAEILKVRKQIKDLKEGRKQ